MLLLTQNLKGIKWHLALDFMQLAVTKLKDLKINMLNQNLTLFTGAMHINANAI